MKSKNETTEKYNLVMCAESIKEKFIILIYYPVVKKSHFHKSSIVKIYIYARKFLPIINKKETFVDLVLLYYYREINNKILLQKSNEYETR